MWNRWDIILPSCPSADSLAKKFSDFFMRKTWNKWYHKCWQLMYVWTCCDGCWRCVGTTMSNITWTLYSEGSIWYYYQVFIKVLWSEASAKTRIPIDYYHYKWMTSWVNSSTLFQKAVAKQAYFDKEELENYWLMSDLAFLSTTVRMAVTKRLESYLNTHGLHDGLPTVQVTPQKLRFWTFIMTSLKPKTTSVLPH